MSSYNPMKLDGKTVLITGASSGIGRAVAVECSRLGATCILTARNEARLKETLNAMNGTAHTVIPADLTDPDAVVSLTDRLPQLDGVSHNAGVHPGAKLCSFAKQEDVEHLFAVNLFSVIELQTLLLKKRRLNKKAGLVFMASMAARTYFPGNAFYGMTKIDLVHYAHDLAEELKPKHIRVNAVCPGMVDTPLTANLNENAYGEDYTQKDRQRYLYGRYGTPAEVAHLVAYLLSDAAEWITGSEFKIDGGAFG